jgi:hypothetical protein
VDQGQVVLAVRENAGEKQLERVCVREAVSNRLFGDQKIKRE